MATHLHHGHRASLGLVVALSAALLTALPAGAESTSFAPAGGPAVSDPTLHVVVLLLFAVAGAAAVASFFVERHAVRAMAAVVWFVGAPLLFLASHGSLPVTLVLAALAFVCAFGSARLHRAATSKDLPRPPTG